MDTSLSSFFRPRGVVVVGASTSPEKLGYGVARNLAQSGYTGAIHFVSHKQGRLFERPLYTSIDEVPGPLDLAVLIVPPQAVIQALQDCGRRGIPAAILVSAGFREAGPEGAALENKCVEVARQNGVRLLGPNCIGIIDTHLPLDTTFLQPPMPAAGDIGFISHSGAFCAAIIDWARRQGFGFSQVVSLGNQADVTETDLLPVVASDVHTRVIALYMEGVSNGRRFLQAAQETVLRKPVVALKVGRFGSGQKAAASHTGALAGSDSAFGAAFSKAGILRAQTTEQMFDWAAALAACPLPAGPRMAILTNAGGPGVIAADALEMNGLIAAELCQASLEELGALLPPAASVHNPVDMLASASPQQYTDCLKILLRDDGVDGVMVILPPPPMFEAGEVAARLTEVIRQAAKPVVIALMGSMLVENALEIFRSAGIPAYPFPERAASALSALVLRSRFLAAPLPALTTLTDRKADMVSGAAGDPLALLAAYGIEIAPARLAHDAEQAAAVASKLGFPVVMKIASPDISHKSDIGGVLLDLSNASEVRSGYDKMMELVRVARPGARIDGILLQHQVAPGQEVIAGMVRDALFGPLVMFGSGGVEVEGLKDVAFALAPLSEEEARAMLKKTWAGRKLKGFRNIPPADEAAVIDTLVKLSCLAMENESVQEIEINPLRVLAQGAIALDARMSFSHTVMDMGADR